MSYSYTQHEVKNRPSPLPSHFHHGKNMRRSKNLHSSVAMSSLPQAHTTSRSGADNTAAPSEDDLRTSLRLAMQELQRSEPIDPSYKRLLLNGLVTPRRPVLPKDKFYKRLGSQLRPRVEYFLQQTEGKDPFDRISQRKPLEEAAMRAAFTLRDAKEHEQHTLLEATLASIPRRNGMDQETRKHHFDAVALGLHSKKVPSFRSPSKSASVMEQTEQAKQQADLDRQIEQARQRELTRKKREEEERLLRDDDMEKRRRHAETPNQALHKLYHPIFKKLWDMEFPLLGGINPFRIVIDRDNCASVGAPDYFDIIDKPMNLTYIQSKVDGMEYESLSAFFADVDLMINNCLLYNSDASNPYHIAAQELKKRYLRIAKKVVQTIQSKQQTRK